MKYQILLLMYLLFTPSLIAQEIDSKPITANGDCVEIYPLKFPQTGAIRHTEELSISSDYYPEYQVVIDQKHDSFYNKYILSYRLKDDKVVTILDKFSDDNVLQWSYSIESFNNFTFMPESVNLTNNTELYITCYKLQQSDATDEDQNMETQFHINAEGDFLTEVVSK